MSVVSLSTFGYAFFLNCRPTNVDGRPNANAGRLVSWAMLIHCLSLSDNWPYMYTVISLIKRGPGESCQVAKCFLQQIKWCPSGYKWIFNNCGIDYVIGQPCKTNSVSVHVFDDQGTIRRLLNIQTFECIDFTRNQCDCSASSDTSVGRSSFFIWRYKKCVLKLDSVIKFLLDCFMEFSTVNYVNVCLYVFLYSCFTLVLTGNLTVMH